MCVSMCVFMGVYVWEPMFTSVIMTMYLSERAPKRKSRVLTSRCSKYIKVQSPA